MPLLYAVSIAVWGVATAMALISDQYNMALLCGLITMKDVQLFFYSKDPI